MGKGKRRTTNDRSARADSGVKNRRSALPTKAVVPAQLLAGVTLLAIAVPEQLATSQLASVPAFTALIAFITASIVFFFIGSNPIASVGADSTIAPLFALAILKVAPSSSTLYLELIAATAVVTGLAVFIIGLLRLGWLADFLSVPIIAGFMSGIGVIIIVHQLPHALGLASSSGSIIHRMHGIFSNLQHVNGWSVAISIGTLLVMVLGEKLNAKLPWALGAVLVATLLSALLQLSAHGVTSLGTVSARFPSWRLHWLHAHQWSVVLTTSVTLVIVIVSQSAATMRTSSDELGVNDNLSRDFMGVGLANVAAGVAGAFPVNASPARTTVARLAGGTTKWVGLVAGLGALVLSPIAKYAHMVPLAALAGVLFFVAGRLIKVSQYRDIARASWVELSFALVSLVGVVFINVEAGLGIAVGLTILDQTWRAAHPRMFELGRRKGTTSWETYDAKKIERVDHVLAVLFDEDIFFANAGVFRHELDDQLASHPHTKHVVIDAVAISDIDYTGIVTLARMVRRLEQEKIGISFARPNDVVRRLIANSHYDEVRRIQLFDSTDQAVNDAQKNST
jgi:SulP family sulfate permease